GDTPATGLNYLTGVACASASNCWAVGRIENGLNFLGSALVEHWDGNSWTTVTPPSTPAALLFRVTCPSTSECWAVGYDGFIDGSTTVYQTLTEHWDASSWTVVNSPNTGAEAVPGEKLDLLNAV